VLCTAGHKLELNRGFQNKKRGSPMRLVELDLERVPETHEVDLAILLDRPSVVGYKLFVVETALKRPLRLGGVFRRHYLDDDVEVEGIAILVLVTRQGKNGEFDSLYVSLPGCVAPVAITKAEPHSAFAGSLPAPEEYEEYLGCKDARVYQSGGKLYYTPLIITGTYERLLAQVGPLFVELLGKTKKPEKDGKPSSKKSEKKVDPFAK
jgi:hypothetical protein